MKEIDRFVKKAAHYREALGRSPASRILELYPILYLLHHHVASTSKSLGEMKILDLMSGSGFLAGCLHQIGFKQIHAIEFCEAMSNNSIVYAKDVRLHQLTDFDHLQGVLESISPDVIVSLASFHHLLCYTPTNSVDASTSRLLQKKVVDICVRCLPSAGLLVVADLIEDDVAESSFPSDAGAMRSTIKDLIALGAEPALAKSLRQCCSFQGASSILRRDVFTKPGNLSLGWFRDVVDAQATIGHKDIAISSQLCELLRPYKPCTSHYSCPWMFTSRDEFASFFHFKFGFALNDTSMAVSADDVAASAEVVLGTKSLYGKTFVGWNLGIIAIWRSDPFESARRYRRIVSSLVAINILLIFVHALRAMTDTYIAFSVPSLLIFAITLPIGVAFGEIMQLMTLAKR